MLQFLALLEYCWIRRLESVKKLWINFPLEIIRISQYKHQTIKLVKDWEGAFLIVVIMCVLLLSCQSLTSHLFRLWQSLCPRKAIRGWPNVFCLLALHACPIALYCKNYKRNNFFFCSAQPCTYNPRQNSLTFTLNNF